MKSVPEWAAPTRFTATMGMPVREDGVSAFLPEDIFEG